MSNDKVTLLKECLVEKNTTVLFGAGASASYFSSLYNFEKLLSNPKINSHGKNLIKVAFFYDAIKNNKYLSNYINRRNYDHAQKGDMLSTINEYVRFLHNVIEYLKVRNSRISPRRINIVTTNYDLFIESAIDKVLQDNSRIFFNDGTNGYGKRILSSDNFNKTMLYSGVFDNYTSEMPCVNLIKCHGSVNWIEYKNGDVSKIQVLLHNDKIHELYNRIEKFTKEFGQKSFIFGIQEDNSFETFITNLNEEISDELIHRINDYGDTFKDSLNKLTNILNDLHIVWPTKQKFEKTLIQEHYFSMLRLLSYELEKEQSLLIVFGFSFDDEHIRDVVQRSLNNPNLMVIIFCYKDENERDIMSNFNFSEGAIPSNVIFIKPSDFLKDTISKKELNEKDYSNKNSTVIINDENVKIYSPLIEKIIDNKKKKEYPVINFSSLNEILDQNIGHRYVGDIQKGERDHYE